MTRLRTHHAVNIGLTAILVGAIMNHPLLSVTIAQAATIFADRIIDLVGHSPSRVHPGIMKRTPLTHSIITAPAWAIAIGVAVTYATNLLFQPATTFYHIRLITLPPDMATPIMVSCLLAAFVHLLLDSLTEAGIYVPHLPCREDTQIFKRWKLAGFQYDNLPLNVSLTLLGLAAYASYLIYGNPHLLNALTTFTKTPLPLELYPVAATVIGHIELIATGRVNLTESFAGQTWLPTLAAAAFVPIAWAGPAYAAKTILQHRHATLHAETRTRTKTEQQKKPNDETIPPPHSDDGEEQRREEPQPPPQSGQIIRIRLSRSAQTTMKAASEIDTVEKLQDYINSQEERYIYTTTIHRPILSGETAEETTYIIVGDIALILAESNNADADYYAKTITQRHRIPKDIREAASLQLMKAQARIVTTPPREPHMTTAERRALEQEIRRLTEILNGYREENRRFREEGEPAVPLDPYAILGIPSNASVQEIKDAYRRLSLIYHPDKSRNPDTAEMFQTIQDAYRKILLQKGTEDIGEEKKQPPEPETPRPRKPLFLAPLAREHIKYLLKNRYLIMPRRSHNLYFPWYSPNEDGEDPHPREVQIYCPSEDRWHWMPATAKHCKECGTPLLPTPQCPHCGCDLIPDRGVYCKQCGTQLPSELAAPQEIAFCIFIKAYGKLTETQTQTIFQDFWENLEKISPRLRHGRDLYQHIRISKARNELLYSLDRREIAVIYMNICDPRTASTLTQLNELQEAFDNAAKETGITGNLLDTATAVFTVVPRILITPNPVDAGNTLTISGSNYVIAGDCSKAGNWLLLPPGITVTYCTIDENYIVKATLAVSNTAPPATYTIILTDGIVEASATVTVQPSGTPAPPLWAAQSTLVSTRS